MTVNFYSSDGEGLEVIPVYENQDELTELCFCIGQESLSINLGEFDRLIKAVELMKQNAI